MDEVTMIWECPDCERQDDVTLECVYVEGTSHPDDAYGTGDLCGRRATATSSSFDVRHARMRRPSEPVSGGTTQQMLQNHARGSSRGITDG